MEVEIQNARDKSQNEVIFQIQEQRHSFLLYALLSYEMLVISPENFVDEKRICKIIELRLQINSSQPEQLSEKTMNIMSRICFFLSRIFPVFREHSALWNQTLTSATKKVLPNSVDYDMQWIAFENSYCWWTQNKAGDYVSVNIMNGIVLVNGSPPSLLALSIRNNQLYRRVFGETDFEVSVGRNGVHKIRNPIGDRYYSFQMSGSELVIFEEFEDKKLLLLDASASSLWCNHIPLGMTELYSHWLYLDKMIVLFRPVSFRERTIYYIVNHNGLYKVPRQFLENLTTLIDAVVSTFDKFVILDPKTMACLAFFSKFEQKEYVHPYLTNEKSLKIVMVRFRIGFELKQHSKFYDCCDFSEYKLRSIQQFNDKMHKFYNYLILEKDSGEHAVIVPQGDVNVTNDIVSIKRSTQVLIDEISSVAHRYNTFTVHNKFGHLQHKDLLSGLQLAAIQAATSSSLPERGTGMTGYEIAIRQVRKCWVNCPLEKEEQRMMKSLLTIKDLPPALVIVSHQLIKNSFHLSFLHKDCPRFDLNLDSFTKALNEYNLPVQPHIYARNFRLSLKFDEKSMAGISRSERHFYSVKRQSNSLQDAVTEYKRKKTEIDSYEDELCSFKFEEKRKDIMEFPLKNLPSFNNKTIGNHIVDKLVRSHQHYSTIPHLIFHGRNKQELVEKMLVDMHKSVELHGQELYNHILDRIFLEMHVSSSFESKALLIEKAANEISGLTMCDLVEAVWRPSSLLGFNPSLSMHAINELFLMIVDWMQFCVLGNRIQQVRQHLQANEIDRALLELSVRRNYDPYQYPKWLAFELDQGLQIRPDQVTILNDILSKNGSVTQLNMGLGKTRVIVPCLILELSKRKKIPRVYRQA